MKKANINQKDLSRLIDLQPSNLNKKLAGKGLFSVKEIDQITQVLGLQPGYFYESLYRSWLVEKRKVSLQNLKDLIVKCLELDKISIADRIVSHILEDQRNLEFLLESGETLYAQNRYKEALYFFQNVYMNERYFNSRRLAFSLYRIFLMSREIDFDYAYDTALLLSPHIKELEGEDRRQAYSKVIAVFFILEKWVLVRQLSQTLADLSKEHDPIMYGDALVYLGIVARVNRQYTRAMFYISQYERISEEFRRWAIGNRLYVLIDQGQSEKLDDLYQYASQYGFPGFTDYLFEKCVELDRLDLIQKALSEHSEGLVNLYRPNNPIEAKRNVVALINLAKYFFAIGKTTEGITELLGATRLSLRHKLRKQATMISLLMFQYKESCTIEQQGEFIQLYSKLLNEGKISL